MALITIEIDDEIMKILKKRAKKNLLNEKEMIEDIVRRSCVNYKKMGYTTISGETDDKLVNIFSRSQRGRKRKSEV